MHELRLNVEKVTGFENRLLAAIPILTDSLKVKDMYYVLGDGRMKAATDKSFDEDASDIPRLMTNDVFSENTFETLEKKSPLLYKALKSHGFESALIVKIGDREEVTGYLVCAAKRSHRIWQENECALLYYLAGLL
jgi:GAF domain-containing protein